MWQDNFSWQHGLFSEVKINRFKGLKAVADQDAVIAVFDRLHQDGGNDKNNLRLHRLLTPNGETITGMEAFLTDFYAVAIDTGLRTLEVKCSFSTARAIAGAVDITIEYEVTDAKLLLRVADPIASLKKRVEQTVQDVAFELDYPGLTSLAIREALLRLETDREIGILLYNALCGVLRWPADIQRAELGPVIEDIHNRNQDARNEYRIRKLEARGITDPFIVTTVLSQDDKDFQVIVGHLQKYADAQHDQRKSQMEFLEWLVARDFITRVEMRRVSERLLDDIGSNLFQPNPLRSFLPNSTNNTARQLGSSADDSVRSDTANQTREVDSESAVKGRRTPVPNVSSDSWSTATSPDASSNTYDIPPSTSDDSPVKGRRTITFSDQDD